MKNILVPVDYSDTAKNAVHYTLGLAEQLQAQKIILYNAFQPPVPVDTFNIADGNFNTIGLGAYDVTALIENSKIHLERVKEEIKTSYSGHVEVEVISEYNTLRDGVETISKTHGIDLIVMGISEADKLSETLIGSNSLDIARHTTTPVIIVPHNAIYTPVQQILFTCDYKHVTGTVPVQLLKNMLSVFNAHLHVLHVDANDETEEHLQQAAVLKNLLSDVPVGYHIMKHSDFKEAVNQFTSQHNIDLIIAIPRKHSFFEGLFHHSHTKTLAFHSHHPLLLVHEH